MKSRSFSTQAIFFSKWHIPHTLFCFKYNKMLLVLQVAPLWMESAVSLVYFGHNGCTPLYYCSPQLVLYYSLTHCVWAPGEVQRPNVIHRCPGLPRCLPSALRPTRRAGWGKTSWSLGLLPSSQRQEAERHAVVCGSEVAIRCLAGCQHYARLSNIWELLCVVYCNYHWASPAEFGLFEQLQSKLQGSVFRG